MKMKQETKKNYLDARALVEGGMSIELACIECNISDKSYFRAKGQLDPRTVESLSAENWQLRRQVIRLTKELKDKK